MIIMAMVYPCNRFLKLNFVAAVEPTPGMRGGHQMVLDPAGQMIYMFGGWDGTRDLSDFWQYDLQRKKWKIVSSETEQEVSSICGRISRKAIT